MTGETANEVVDQVADGDIAVTRDQLVRWHRSGLIPRPSVRHLGRGRGSESVYPPGTSLQVAALVEIKSRFRRLDDVGWLLWWGGFEVDEAVLRNRIDLFIQLWSDGYKEFLESSSESALGSAKLDALADARLPNRSMRWIRQRTGRQGFVDLMGDLVRALRDGPGAVDDVGMSRLSTILDIEESGSIVGIAETLGAVGRLFQPDVLQVTSNAASVEQLSAARDKIRQLATIVTAFGEVSLAVNGRWTPRIGAFSTFLGDTLAQPDGQVLSTLAWLSLESEGLTEGSSAIFDLSAQADRTRREWIAIQEIRALLPPDERYLVRPRRLGRANTSLQEMARLQEDIAGIRSRYGDAIDAVLERHGLAREPKG